MTKRRRAPRDVICGPLVSTWPLQRVEQHGDNDPALGPLLRTDCERCQRQIWARSAVLMFHPDAERVCTECVNDADVFA